LPVPVKISRLRKSLPEKLLCPPLIGGESDDLPHQVAHELVVLGELALAARRLGLQRVLGGLVTLLQTHADLITGGHFSLLQREETNLRGCRI